MLFNSLDFFLFFPIVCCIYFFLPSRLQWAWLLAASIYFYMAFVPVYILILFGLIVVDYFVGLLLERFKGPTRRWFLWFSLSANIGLLFVFKYFNFFNANLASLAQALHWNYSIGLLSLLLPIGLSFHIFQSLSYIIEVYRGNQKAERHIGIYALYVLFFPQLVAGPIERPQNLLHQFHAKHAFDMGRVAAGLRLMSWGFFQKVVIADTAAVYVNQIFVAPTSFTGLALVLAVVLFAFQAYGDFSGYSDIARGSAQVLGFRLMENFNRPYVSHSIAEFWRRWHISLSSWLKDYVYFPLVRAVARPGVRWICVSLFITFLLSGLWHGAGWTYVAMGALHGTYLVTSVLTKSIRERVVSILRLQRVPSLHAALQNLYILILVCVSWIFFRANTISDAWYILTHLHVGLFAVNLPHTSLDPYQWASLVCAICVLSWWEWFEVRVQQLSLFIARTAAHAVTADYLLLSWIMYFGYFTKQPFIYFQF